MADITDLGASGLMREVAAGRLSVAEIMSAYLDRIEAVNPTINAIVSLRDRSSLMAEAEAADQVPLEARGPLHGLPLAVKDLAAVKGIRSTWGSPIFADTVPAKDDLMPSRLRGAGAILIGKTNTPEFGLGSHSYNPVHGVTGNPYDPSRSAGGSSGGAAAALAARIAPVADGSDMMGSLRNPAAFCNVYGYRPTWGRVPAEPAGDTFLHQLATDGPMARNIEDLARLLEVLAAPDPRQPHSRPNEAFSEGLDIDIKGLRIGWLGDWGGAYRYEPGILDLTRKALAVFEAQGAVVEDLSAPYPAEKIWKSWTVLRGWAVASKLGVHAEGPRRDLLKPEAIWEITHGASYSAADVHRASVLRSEWNTVAAGLFERFDLLVLPSAQIWPFPKEWTWPKEIAGQDMDTYHRWMEVVIPAGLLGLPVLAAPAGFGDQGLPMGFQIIARRGADRRLLQIGQAWHRATDWPGKVLPRL